MNTNDKRLKIMGWVDSKERLPNHCQRVLVHGGVAEFRNGEWFTGMDDPAWTRPIQWEVTHWKALSECCPTLQPVDN